jgi:hypothetical protein
VLAARVLDLNAVVAGIEPIVRRLIGEDIDVVVVPGPPLGRVKADPGQIEQVILNLAVLQKVREVLDGAAARRGGRGPDRIDGRGRAGRRLAAPSGR